MNKTMNGFLLATITWILLCANNMPAYAKLDDLPIGHFKITDYGDEGINVEARCVSMTEIVEALAERAGRQIVFEKPCYTYVSIWRPHIKAPIEKWVRDVLLDGSAASAYPVFEGDIWRVRLGSIRDYDPTLTEEEVFEAYASAPPEALSVSSGIATGRFIYDGYFIRPPYRTAVTTTTVGFVELTLNGITLFKRPLSAPKTPSARDPGLPPSGQIDEPGKLAAYVNRTLYPRLISEGFDRQETIARVADFLSGQRIIDKVLIEDNPEAKAPFPRPWPDSLLVVYRGESFPCSILGADLNRDTGQTTPMKDMPTAQEFAEMRQTVICARLENDRTVIVDGDGITITLPVGELERVVNQARGLALLKAECVFSESIAPRSICRKLAVRLFQDSEVVFKNTAAQRSKH